MYNSYKFTGEQMKMTVKEKIMAFINEMGYLNNEHVLGVLFYGSFLTGYNKPDSDIDLHVIFDNSNPEHLIRGNKIIAGTRIEYFEKPLNDIYMTVDNEYNTQNNASLSIIGKSVIIFDKYGDLSHLQKYTIDKFSKPLPKLDSEEAREFISILNNRMERLRKAALYNDPHFNHLYHLTIEKIRKFYHRLKGLTKISTSKVYRAYTDEKYRQSFYADAIPEKEFVDMYLHAITTDENDKLEKLKIVEALFTFASRDVNLDGPDYRIAIKSRNVPSSIMGLREKYQDGEPGFQKTIRYNGRNKNV